MNKNMDDAELSKELDANAAELEQLAIELKPKAKAKSTRKPSDLLRERIARARESQQP